MERIERMTKCVISYCYDGTVHELRFQPNAVRNVLNMELDESEGGGFCLLLYLNDAIDSSYLCVVEHKENEICETPNDDMRFYSVAKTLRAFFGFVPNLLIDEHYDRESVRDDGCDGENYYVRVKGWCRKTELGERAYKQGDCCAVRVNVEFTSSVQWYE